MICVEGALVLRSTGFEAATVLIDGDRVAEVGVFPTPAGTRVIDGRGALLGPGFVDLHCHFREPGETWKEDMASGAKAAIAGGFTAVVVMPNTDPAIDDSRKVMSLSNRAEEVGSLDVAVAGALTRGRQGLEMADLEGMYAAGVRIFTDDGDSVSDAGLLRRIFSYLSGLPGAVVAEHPEDRTITAQGHLNEGLVSATHGVVGLPSIGEEIVVGRDLALAADVGARIHLQHLSTAGSVELVRQARDEGVAVTSEVTPHHLLLEEGALADLDANLKMYPPLRSEGDRARLVAGVIEGTVDAVATDHAPHAVYEKDVPFEDAPRGVIGLETAAAASLEALGGDAELLFRAMSIAPAGIAGLDRHGNFVEPGAPANLVLFDPARQWVAEQFRSKSANSPFLGRKMTGKALVTINAGRVVFEEGRDV